MKNTIPLLMGLCAIYSIPGYAHTHHTTYVVEQPATYIVVQPEMQSHLEVDSAPPAEFEETVEQSPGANYVWLKGSWKWDGTQWVKVHGHWGIKPNASAVWIPGYWQEHHHKWKWVPGYWQ